MVVSRRQIPRLLPDPGVEKNPQLPGWVRLGTDWLLESSPSPWRLSVSTICSSSLPSGGQSHTGLS